MSSTVASLGGGVLIGAAAALLLLRDGRLAGISGIVDGALGGRGGDRAWRIWFLVGLVVGGALIAWRWPGAFTYALPGGAPRLVVAGLLVGFGTRLGGGCTSGHGVCGVGRLSRPSIVATLAFMASGMATVFVVVHLLGVWR